MAVLHRFYSKCKSHRTFQTLFSAFILTVLQIIILNFVFNVECALFLLCIKFDNQDSIEELVICFSVCSVCNILFVDNYAYIHLLNLQ